MIESKTHIFDCDGVITDSNSLKTRAFQSTAKKFLSDNALDDLMLFHSRNGGKSRWDKFSYILAKHRILNCDIHQLCEEYSNFVESNMFQLGLVKGVKDYMRFLVSTNQNNIIYVASGGEQEQVRRLIDFHNLPIKPCNILGSPANKLEIVKSIYLKNPQSQFALYGDSLYDAECASSISSKFVFVSNYTNVDYTKILKNNYKIDYLIGDFSEIVKPII